LSKFGIHETDIDRMKSFIGPPLLESFIHHYGFTEQDAEKSLPIYRHHYRTIGMYENKLYPGITELLQDLKQRGKTLAVATAKGEWTANQVLENFKIRSFFDVVVASDMTVQRNYKHQIIALALEKLAVNDKKEVVMVGDRDADILGARKNGIDSIAVAYGYGTEEERQRCQPTHIIHTVAELRERL
jgi:phosphoglycolate phosphatase